MLDDTLLAQLKGHLALLRNPIHLIATLDETPSSQEMRALLEQLVTLSPHITFEDKGSDAHCPSFVVARAGEQTGVRFAAIPLGHEFTSLVLALLWTGGHPPKVAPDVLTQIGQLQGELNLEVFMSLSCHNCPDVVQAACLIAVFNPRVKTTIIDGALYQAQMQERGILAVPMIYLNGEPLLAGRTSLEDLLAKLEGDDATQKQQQAQTQALAEKAPYDVLIVGGGPAGAAAAIYAARKGIRVGLLAQRLGGQVNDTLSIENYISVLQTQGPQLAADLQAHVRHYNVDVMEGQSAARLIPRAQTDQQPSSYVGVQTQSGVTLQAKSVILSTGARWRNINVPGEQDYKNKGVTYCPHCDGPLFKGKTVAVIGGGNSGVEAAIDLAGVVQHVTLIEFADQLRADAVLVQKLQSLPHVTIHLNAQTTEILGDGKTVTGLSYKDRATHELRTVSLSGVFVQIGLIPNTEWLQGAVDLTKFGEIQIDAKGQTNVPGVFAAGDCTTVPYKQIVIAAGAGATAALSAFDYLIRHG